MERRVVMTGDRPTGAMHIGHYFGSLRKRFEMQEDYRCFFMIADYQALTTHADRTRDLERQVRGMVLDYFAAGFDPNRSVCFLQSQVPQLAELTTIFANLVSLSRLLRNPTVKQEMAHMDGSRASSFAFVGYPISQAADILMFRPAYVPVGPDQRPHLELTREVAQRFNGMFDPVFPIPEAVYGEQLGGTDGGTKMGTSLGNAIGLVEPKADIERGLAGMVTDPARRRREDPGDPGVCPVFRMHETVGTADADAVARGCRTAGIGCTDCKSLLAEALEDLVAPMRERRAELDGNDGLVRDVLNLGGSEARVEAQRTLERVKEAMGLDYAGLMRPSSAA